MILQTEDSMYARCIPCVPSETHTVTCFQRTTHSQDTSDNHQHSVRKPSHIRGPSVRPRARSRSVGHPQEVAPRRAVRRAPQEVASPRRAVRRAPPGSRPLYARSVGHPQEVVGDAACLAESAEHGAVYGGRVVTHRVLAGKVEPRLPLQAYRQ